MTTGITQDVHDGKADLRSYLMTVGRQMMFAVLQRDEGPGPVRVREDPTRFERERVKEAEARVEELVGLTRVQVAQAAHASLVEAKRAWDDRTAHDAEVLARYTAMREQVEAWEPDSLVAYVKEVALRFLDESIAYDCPDRNPELEAQYPRLFGQPVEEEPREWFTREMADAERMLTDARESLERAENREAERRAHAEAFLASLPPEEPPW